MKQDIFYFDSPVFNFYVNDPPIFEDSSSDFFNTSETNVSPEPQEFPEEFPETNTESIPKKKKSISKRKTSVEYLEDKQKWQYIEDPITRRQIRNRCAAQRSRKKKISEMEALKIQYASLLAEKDSILNLVIQLQEENNFLKEKLFAIEVTKN